MSNQQMSPSNLRYALTSDARGDSDDVSEFDQMRFDCGQVFLVRHKHPLVHQREVRLLIANVIVAIRLQKSNTIVGN